MSRTHATALAGVVAFAAWLTWTGSVSAQTRSLVAYATDVNAPTACLISNPSNNLPSKIPLNVDTTLDLCFLVWPIDPSPFPACSPPGTGQTAGSESCAELLTYTVGGGMVVVDAQGITGAPFPDYKVESDPATVTVMGGDPLVGQQGVQGPPYQGMRVGRVTLRASDDMDYFELQSSAYAAADLSRLENDTNVVIAEGLGQCGNQVIDPGEDCDDGINNYVSGCSPACTTPYFIWLEGQAGTPLAGSLTFDLDATTTTAAVQGNAPAYEVAEAVAARIELDGVEAATPEPGVIAADGVLFIPDPPDYPTAINDPNATQGTLSIAQPVPEPTEILLLVSGLAFLVGIGRSRVRPWA